MPKVKIGTAHGVTVEVEANETSVDELRKQAMDSFIQAHAVMHPTKPHGGLRQPTTTIRTGEIMNLEALSRFAPTQAHTWPQAERTDALIAVDLVAQTVETEAKKNPVQQQPAYLGYPAMNSYLFGQTMHDVGKAVMDELIRAGWVPPSRVREPEPRPAPDISWIVEPAKPAWPMWRAIAVVGGIPAAVIAAMVVTWLVAR